LSFFSLSFLLLAMAGAPSWERATPSAPASPHGSRSVSPLPAIPLLDSERLKLGESLFKDPRLSSHGKVGCQSCHDVDANGASSKAHDRGDDNSLSPLNTPTVFNAALNFRLGWEGHIRTMPEMVQESMHNVHIMGGSAPGLDRLNRDPTVARIALHIYHRPLDEGAAADAIATYLRSRLTPGARFDAWMTGDVHALSLREQRGWMRFQEVGCSSCHQGVNIGGNLFQRHGIFHPLAASFPVILRVPSLRNIATTAPYFHDGSAATLTDAVVSMGRAQLDLNLSATDVRDIIAFLNTLTGTTEGRPIQGKPR